MAKSKAKTVQTGVEPRAFIEALDHPTRRSDGLALLETFDRITGLKPRMWGPSIIGYGRYAYTYESGHSGESLVTGFSPRKSNLVFYIMPGYRGEDMTERLSRLGKHKLGKACLYVNKLADIDMPVLEEIILAGVEDIRARYETWDV
ncbi:MAG: DUF1801 domain-containing protein [Pseudomonadota bacterium]